MDTERPILDSDINWTEEMQQKRIAQGRGIPLRLLAVGERFSLAAIPLLKGTVVRVGNMGVAVRFGSGVVKKHVEATDPLTGAVKVVDFTTKTSPDIISGESEVIPLPQGV